MKSPCKNCTKRTLACHGKCLDKLEYDVMYKPPSNQREWYRADTLARMSDVGRCKESKRRVRSNTKEYLIGQNISYITHIRTDIAVESL
ncbi:MAG: hypothetical protein ACRC1P_09990 [Cellulosilyticaceae bacterium]